VKILKKFREMFKGLRFLWIEETRLDNVTMTNSTPLFCSTISLSLSACVSPVSVSLAGCLRGLGGGGGRGRGGGPARGRGGELDVG
jgi:hypothetical protein